MQDLTQITERGLIAVYAETTRARRTLRSTAEFQDLEQAREDFEAAIEPIDKTFPSANGIEQAFVDDCAVLLETGVREASSAKQIAEYLVAVRELARQASKARDTGKVVRANVTLAAVRVLRSRIARAEALAGRYEREQEDLCDELERSPGLEEFSELAADYCAAIPPPDRAEKPREPLVPAGESPSRRLRPNRRPVARLNEDSKLSTQGLGPVLAGMTVAEVSKAAGVELKPVSPSGSSEGCQYFEAPGLEGVSFMVSNGSVARVDVHERGVAILSGIRIGDPEDAVTAAYGDRLTAESDFYDDDATQYTYVPEDPGDDTRMIITALEGQVTAIRAGRLPEVEYVEGCV